MIRTLTANHKTEMAANSSRHYHLIRIDTSPALLLTTSYNNITYNSEVYLSTGFDLVIPIIDDDLDLKVRRYKFLLSSVNQANTAAFLLTPPYFKTVDLYKFWVDSGGSIIDDPVLIFSGYFANFSNKMNQKTGKSEMTIDAVSEFVDFDRINGRQTNDDSQQRVFSGDTCLRHSETKYENLPWGKP